MSQWKLPELLAFVVGPDNTLTPVGTARRTDAGIEVELSGGAYIKTAAGNGSKPKQLVLTNPSPQREASNG